jgi:arylsulfatase A-like enzyme
MQLWEALVRIPLLIRLPGRGHVGTRITDMAGQVDLLPTLLDLAGATPADWADGRSLRPVWEGRAEPPPLRFSFVGMGSFDHPTRRGMIALHDGTWKFILNLVTGHEMLFDLAADPAELHDLTVEAPERCTHYRAAAREIVARHDRAETAA